MTKLVFKKVEQLKPGTSGHNLVVKVVTSTTVLQKGCPVDLLKADSTVILRNAKIDMFNGFMTLAVDKWGRVEVTEPAKFVVKKDNNLSLVEYELVNVA
ncbi:hypothetical protein MKX01_030880 [Papaver californicum]|nr:hypothetical protein MKX01_030880 [Papaver californicum]